MGALLKVQTSRHSSLTSVTRLWVVAGRTFKQGKWKQTDAFKIRAHMRQNRPKHLRAFTAVAIWRSELWTLALGRLVIYPPLSNLLLHHGHNQEPRGSFRSFLGGLLSQSLEPRALTWAGRTEWVVDKGGTWEAAGWLRRGYNRGLNWRARRGRLSGNIYKRKKKGQNNLSS